MSETAAVKQYDGLKHGDDLSDAKHLAQPLRLGILLQGYIAMRSTWPSPCGWGSYCRGTSATGAASLA